MKKGKVVTAALIPLDRIERKILLIRGHKVMLDSDLAALYGVTTKRLNEQVARNRARFPADFMFQLTPDEQAALRSHFATLKPGRGRHSKYLASAFTEHGAIMAASVLNSPRAVTVSVLVVRTFVRLRVMLSDNKSLAVRLNELERKLTDHDGAIRNLVQAIRKLMTPPAPKKRHKIGF